MIRTYLSNDYIKRTIRPLYSWTQATPKACFLDPNWQRSVPIWPGMGFVRTGGDLVTLAGASSTQMNSATMVGSTNGGGGSTVTANAVPIVGLGALYVGGDGIDELLYAGINTFAVWVLGPDAEFEILAPAFDATQTWTDPTNGSGAQLVAVSTAGANQGMLIPAVAAGTTTATAPVAKLLKVNSSTKLTIGGLSPYDAAMLTAAVN